MNYIGKKWSIGEGAPFFSLNAATQEKIWEGCAASEKEVEQAFIAAKAAFPHWSRRPLQDRISYLEKFAKVLQEQTSFLVEWISKESGKPLWEAHQEVTSMIQKIPISIQAYLERTPEKKIENVTLHHKPHGVAAILGPFNFPAHLPNGHIIPALLAGNTVILKGSDKTPGVTEFITECWEKVDLPCGVFNMLQGKVETAQAVVKHPDLNALFFTGSYHTGLSILRQLCPHPGKILALEMGGNNPLVVWDVEDPQAAAYTVLLSAFLTSGQRCTCARRLIVPEGERGNAVLKELVSFTNSLIIGPYTSIPEPFMGPVISMEAKHSLLAAQTALKERGGQVLHEMKSLDDKTPFLSPGIMDVTDLIEKSDEEFFGPFLQVVRAKNFESALEEANRTSYGLTASLLSANPKLYREFYYSIKAGIINWNTPTTGASSKAPFGGIGNSGNHRPSAFYAADYCAYPVTSLENSELNLPNHLYPGVSHVSGRRQTRI